MLDLDRPVWCLHGCFMYIYKGCLGKGWNCSGGIFANDTALAADSEEKLCRLVSECAW